MIVDSQELHFGEDFICMRRYSYVTGVSYIAVKDMLFGLCEDGFYRANNVAYGNICIDGIDDV